MNLIFLRLPSFMNLPFLIFAAETRNRKITGFLYAFPVVKTVQRPEKKFLLYINP